VRTLNAHFDGKFIVLDEPARLKPNAKVKVIAPDADEVDDGLGDGFARLSEPTFRAIWDNPLDADYDHLFSLDLPAGGTTSDRPAEAEHFVLW
jgi:hypothetical protein